MSAARPQERLAELVDRAEIAGLIDGYLLAHDSGDFDQELAALVFTEDVELSFPPGDHSGLAGTAEFTHGFMRHWARTHHHCSPYRIAVRAHAATIGWNVIATHIHHDSPPPPAPGHLFQLGGRFEGAAVRTAAGWRIRQLALRVLWTTGMGVPSIAATMAAARGQ